MSIMKSLCSVILALCIVVSGLVLTGVPAYAATTCTPIESRSIENRVHALINMERSSRGLNSLIRMQSVDQMAQDWSSTMYATGNFQHRSDLAGPVPGNWSSVGENILYFSGYNCDVVANSNHAVSQWMNSPGHRQNILNPSYTHVGYGFISGSSSNRTYGTQNFVGYGSSAPPTAASISISPSLGAPGTTVSVTGQGYPAGFRVNLTLEPTGQFLGNVTTNSIGSFSRNVTIPSVSGGTYTIRARVDDGVIHRDATFYVDSANATLGLSPRNVGPAGVVSFFGENFLPGERVDIRWGSAYGAIIGYVDASGNGSVSGRVTVRATMSGTYMIVARGTSSHKAIGANVVVNGVDPHITVSPSVTGAGTVVGVTGQGFAPWETVHITWNTYTGRVLGIVQSGSDGTIAGRITIPVDANGTYNVYARGLTSYVTVRQRVAVTSTMQSRMATEAPQISLSQSALTMGATTSLSGRGFQPGEDVTITTGWGADLTTLAAGENGRFETDITIPDPVPYADQAQTIRANGAESNNEAETPFSISDWDRANVDLSPSDGPVDTTTTITSQGFAPGELVTVHNQTSDGPVMAEANADEHGVVTVDVTIPADAVGSIDLIVVGTDGLLLGKGTFTISEEVAGTPASTPESIPEIGTPPAEIDLSEAPVTPAVPSTPIPTESDGPVEEPITELIGTPTEVLTEEPVETPTEVPTDEPTETPTEVPTEDPIETPTEEPTDVPVEQPQATPVLDEAALTHRVFAVRHVKRLI